MERLVLTNQFNRIECTVLNSPFAKLSLWHYRELLLETNKTYLEYQLPPYQFGQFTCQFTGSSKSAIVRENGRHVKICNSTKCAFTSIWLHCYLDSIVILYIIVCPSIPPIYIF